MLLHVVHSLGPHVVRFFFFCNSLSIHLYSFTLTVVPIESRNSQFYLSFAQLFLNSVENDLRKLPVQFGMSYFTQYIANKNQTVK